MRRWCWGQGNWWVLGIFGQHTILAEFELWAVTVDYTCHSHIPYLLWLLCSTTFHYPRPKAIDCYGSRRVMWRRSLLWSEVVEASLRPAASSISSAGFEIPPQANNHWEKSTSKRSVHWIKGWCGSNDRRWWYAWMNTTKAGILLVFTSCKECYYYMYVHVQA